MACVPDTLVPTTAGTARIYSTAGCGQMDLGPARLLGTIDGCQFGLTRWASKVALARPGAVSPQAGGWMGGGEVSKIHKNAQVSVTHAFDVSR